MVETLDWILHEALAVGPLTLIAALALGMFLNSSVMVPPSEYLGVFGGIYSASHGPLFLILLIAVLAVANLAGTTPWYLIGRHRSGISKPFLPLQTAKLRPKFLGRLYLAQLPKVLDAFVRTEEFLVFSLRLVPVIRSIISYPAGYARMPSRKFFPLSLAGIVIWVAVWAVLGYAIGSVAYAFSVPIGLLSATAIVTLYYLVRTPFALGDER